MKKFLTLLLVLAVVVGMTATIGFAAGTETLTGNLDSKVITEDTELNLAGFSIGTLTVEPGVTVTVSGAGSTGTITTVTGGGIVELADGFMLWGSTSNKLTLGTAGVSLRADEIAKNGASVYYTSTFGGNATVKSKIAAYGVAMYIGSAKNLFADNTYTKNEDLTGWNTGVATFNDNGVLLKGILKTNNAYSLNKANAIKQIYNVPYVELADGTRITGATVNRSLQNVVESATASTNPGSDNWDKYGYTQKTNIVNLYDTFERIMSGWNMPRLTPLVDDDTDTVYTLYNASDVQMMSQFPDNSYFLNNYINMGGVTLNTIENFTGSIDGNGHTISNFKLNGTGFVDQVAAGESITGLYLTNVTMVVPAKSTALNVGLIAGTNNGSITGVAASGTIRDTRTGAANAEINVGALVGKNAGSLTTEAILSVTETAPNVLGEEQTFTTTGLSADVGLFVEKSDYVNTGLVGAGNAVSNAANVYWRDRSGSSEGQVAELQNRRDTVVEEMYKSGTYKWTPAKSFTHYGGVRETIYGDYADPSNVHTQSFTKGKTYIGTPYDHTSASYDQVMHFMTEGANDVYTADVSSETSAWNNTWGKTSPYEGFTLYIGSDCSSAVTMAWHKVSPVLYNSKDNKGISLWYTETIVPSEYNQYYFGVRKVGDYTVDDATMSDGIKLTTKDADGNVIDATYTNLNEETKYRYKVTTDAIVEKIGVNAVYEAYAQAKKGDILISSGTGGHCRMLAIDPIAIRNGNDVIDPAKSYFVTHEQGDGLYEREDTNSSWRINYKYTFKQLAYKDLTAQEKTDLTGTDGYYLPVTMDALINAGVSSSGGFSTANTYFNNEGDTELNFKINSSFRILKAQLIIYDKNGEEVYNKTRFQGASNSQYSRRAYPGYAPMYSHQCFTDYATNLKVGETYTYKVIAENYTGGKQTYENTFTDNKNVTYTLSFTYNPAS